MLEQAQQQQRTRSRSGSANNREEGPAAAAAAAATAAPRPPAEGVEQVNNKKLDVVAAWLDTLNIANATRYAALFRKHEIDMDALRLMEDEDLVDIGVTAKGPRVKILANLRDVPPS